VGTMKELPKQFTTSRQSNVFDRNPRKTILAVLFVFTAALDFTFAHLVNVLTEGRFDRRYHHDLKPNLSQWTAYGPLRYHIVTNELGFKDSVRRKVPATSKQKRIVVIGDSFTEGVGYPYEQTFAGLLSAELAKEGVEVLNAGVQSYSPKLSYLKLRHLLEHQVLHFDELWVFIDISDIQDEVKYDSFVSGRSEPWIARINHYFNDNSFVFNTIVERILPKYRTVPQHKLERATWTHDDEVYSRWGNRGLTLAKRHMDEIYRLCRQYGIRLTVGVYPWPFQLRQKDPEARQVAAWRQFTDERGIDYINLFPSFHSDDPARAIATFFIPGDFHWNEKGHQLVFSSLLRHYRTRSH
jgi:hypothetical protein